MPPQGFRWGVVPVLSWFKDQNYTALVVAGRATFLYTWTCFINDSPFHTGLFVNNPGTISFPSCSKKEDRATERRQSWSGESQRKEALSFTKTSPP